MTVYEYNNVACIGSSEKRTALNNWKIHNFFCNAIHWNRSDMKKSLVVSVDMDNNRVIREEVKKKLTYCMEHSLKTAIKEIHDLICHTDVAFITLI